MPTSFFSDERLTQLGALSRSASRAQDLQTFASQVLTFLLSCGFRSARYYECATNRAENDEVLILSTQEPSDSTVRLGYQIPYKSSTIGCATEPTAPAVGCSQSTNASWVADLNLGRDRCWVDVPVRVQGKLVGLIAADWASQDTSAIPHSDLAVLSLIGNMVAGVSEQVSVTNADAVEKAFTGSLSRSETVEAALTTATEELVNTVGFAVVAAFERSRSGTVLNKILECVHPAIGRDTPTFKEGYPVGQFLTGLAWEKAEFRHVVDFGALVARRRHEVETRSFDRHTALLSKVTSVLYSRIESREPRYMLRAMNCAESPLPIAGAHRKVVDRITRSIASHLDDVVGRRRLSQVVKMARVASRNVTRPREVVSSVREAIQQEGFDDIVVIARHREQVVGATFIDAPTGFSPLKAAPIEWSDKAFSVLASDLPVVKPISSLMEGSTHELFRWLHSQGYLHLAAQNFDAANVRVLMCVPFRDTSVRSQGALPQLVETYAAVICSAIEGFDSHVTAEGSLRFMGRIGHEVRAPALDASQAAIFGLATAKRIVGTVPAGPDRDSVLREIDESLRLVNNKGREIDRMMDFAKLAALEEVGEVPFNFQEVDLGHLVRETVQSLREQGELATATKGGSMRQCEIATNKAVLALGTVVADKGYVKVVLQHLLRNAAKYSLPRFGAKPPEIRLLARPEPQWAILQVVNWGVGIAEDEFESIFRPHVRGTAHDKRKAIAGLGLGLYISRLLVKAHHGSIFCQRSVPTLDDEARTLQFEGFETAFEVRLPRAGATGVRTIALGGKA